MANIRHNPFPQWPLNSYTSQGEECREWRIAGCWYDEDDLKDWPLKLYLEYIKGMNEGKQNV